MTWLEIIDANWNKESGTFLERLRDGKFDRGEFNRLIISIDQIHKTPLTEVERLDISCKVWAISYDVTASIVCHFNPNDGFEIGNMSEENRSKAIKVLGFVSARFNKGKSFNLADMLL
jgi:hypothetical protein